MLRYSLVGTPVGKNYYVVLRFFLRCIMLDWYAEGSVLMYRVHAARSLACASHQLKI
jgi:hypothetical protein